MAGHHSAFWFGSKNRSLMLSLISRCTQAAGHLWGNGLPQVSGLRYMNSLWNEATWRLLVTSEPLLSSSGRASSKCEFLSSIWLPDAWAQSVLTMHARVLNHVLWGHVQYLLHFSNFSLVLSFQRCCLTSSHMWTQSSHLPRWLITLCNISITVLKGHYWEPLDFWSLLPR